MGIHRLLLYGTLRHGGSNHAAVLEGEAYRRLGEAYTAPIFKFLNFGPCPALVQGGKTSVKGDLVEVSSETLEKIDKYEAAYTRQEVRLTNGEKAQAYVLDEARAGSRPSRPIVSGDWLKRGPWKR